MNMHAELSSLALTTASDAVLQLPDFSTEELNYKQISAHK